MVSLLQIVSNHSKALDTVWMHTAASSPHGVGNGYSRTIPNWTQLGDLHWVYSLRVVPNMAKCIASYQVQSSRSGSLRALLLSVNPYSPLKLGPLAAVEGWALRNGVCVHKGRTKAVCGVGVSCAWDEMTFVKLLTQVYCIASLSPDTFNLRLKSMTNC